MGKELDTLKGEVEANPENADLRMDYGVTLAEVGQLQEAVTQFEKAVDINPEMAKAHYNLGVIYGKFLLEDLAIDEYWEDHTDEEALFEKSSACYKEALRLEPKMTAAINNLARITAAMGLHDEACKLFNQSLEIDNSQPDVQQEIQDLKEWPRPGE